MPFARILVAVFIVALTALCTSSCPEDVAPLMDALFASLGDDCDTYISLYADDVSFYHQIEGYKVRSELTAMCEGYGGFCTPGDCSFQRDGAPFVYANGDKCEILAPFLWSQLPPNNLVPNNREPHSGWIHNTVVVNESSEYGYSIEVFREIEESYAVAFNWGMPNDTSAYEWTTALLTASPGNDGSCDAPLPTYLTQFFTDMSNGVGGDQLWRQQGRAITLGTGGICHVLVPYAAALSGVLSSGMMVLELTPNGDDDYDASATFDFPLSSMELTVSTQSKAAVLEMTQISSIIAVALATTRF